MLLSWAIDDDGEDDDDDKGEDVFTECDQNWVKVRLRSDSMTAKGRRPLTCGMWSVNHMDKQSDR